MESEIKILLQNIANDTTCPIHIAAEIEQIIELLEYKNCTGCWTKQKDLIESYLSGCETFFYQCSNCQKSVRDKSHFCPNCGVKMDG